MRYPLLGVLMLRRLPMLALLAGAVFVAACGDSRGSMPTSPELQIGSTCTPSNIKKFAKALAGTGSPLYNYAQQFTSQNANSTFATNLFFDLAAEAATLARPGALSTTQKSDLANLLIQGIACADVVTSDANYSGLNYVSTFALAAGSTGMLEVRGRNSSENAIIYSHNQGTHGSAGVKAPTAGFAAWYGGRALFYGFPIAGFSDETPPGSDIAYQIFTVRPRSNVLSPTLRGQVAFCVASIVANPAQFRIQRAETILPVGEGFNELPCPETLGMGSRGDQSKSPIGSVVAWVRRNLLPEPLHAAGFLLTVKPSGSPKTLSPFEVINPLGATLTYVPAPSDGLITQGLGVTVHATGAAGTDWEGLLIKITAQDNNGRFVQVSPDTATTNASGIANFSTSTINKAGVYQLLAVTLPSTDADAAAFTQDSVLSGNFLRRPN
jgi:hypothetical protein